MPETQRGEYDHIQADWLQSNQGEPNA
jgi:hypothetical protein